MPGELCCRLPADRDIHINWKYIHTYMHSYIYTHIHTRIHTYIHTHIHTHTHTRTRYIQLKLLTLGLNGWVRFVPTSAVPVNTMSLTRDLCTTSCTNCSNISPALLYSYQAHCCVTHLTVLFISLVSPTTCTHIHYISIPSSFYMFQFANGFA